MTDEYPPPVDRLLTYGPGEAAGVDGWPDYVQELGLGPEQIPDLIRLATDHDLRWQEEETDTLWAPVHAWRALGQLHAQEAIAPLLGLLDSGDDEWAGEEVPEVYGMLGPAAIPALAEYVADAGHDWYGRANAMTALERIAQQHPASRDAVIAVLMHQLEDFNETDEEVNAYLVISLSKLKATEALPLIEQAYAADRVDETVTDWDWVQVEFGLKSEEEMLREREQRRAEEARRAGDAHFREPRIAVSTRDDPPLIVTPLRTPAKAKAKTKRKMAQESRKKNKKRK